MGDLGDLLRQLEKRTRESPTAGIVGPGPALVDNPLESRFYRPPGNIGTSYAGASVFLYRPLIGFALTNGAFVFFTAGSTGLRPLNTF